MLNQTLSEVQFKETQAGRGYVIGKSVFHGSSNFDLITSKGKEEITVLKGAPPLAAVGFAKQNRTRRMSAAAPQERRGTGAARSVRK